MNYLYGLIAALLIAMGATIWMQHNNNVAMSTTLTAVTSERDAALKNQETLTKSATSWQDLANSCNDSFEKYKEQQKHLADANAAAVKAANAKAAVAAANAKAANARVDVAMRGGDCSTILNTPVCKEAFQ